MRKAALIPGIIGGVGGFITIAAGYIFGGPLLITGGILALVTRRKTSVSFPVPSVPAQ